VFLRAPVYVAETDQRPREEPEDSIMYFFYRYLGERLVDSANPLRGAGGRGPRRARWAAADHHL